MYLCQGPSRVPSLHRDWGEAVLLGCCCPLGEPCFARRGLYDRRSLCYLYCCLPCGSWSELLSLSRGDALNFLRWFILPWCPRISFFSQYWVSWCVFVGLAVFISAFPIAQSAAYSYPGRLSNIKIKVWVHENPSACMWNDDSALKCPVSCSSSSNQRA